MEKELIGRLLIQSQGGEEKMVELYPDAVITIGRSHDNAVYIPDDTVSQHHAELRVNRGSVQFQNHGRNGSIVDNRAVYDSEWIALSDGAVIRIGKYNLQLQLLPREPTKIISQTMVMPQDSKPSGDLDKTMFFPAPDRRRENQLVANASQGNGQFGDPDQTMFFQTPIRQNEDQLVDGAAGQNNLPDFGQSDEQAKTMFFPAPNNRREDQLAANAASRSELPKKRALTAFTPAAKSTAPRRWGLPSGFLKTKMGKVSAGLIVLILGLYVLMPSQENKAAASKPKAQIKKGMAGKASSPAVRPVVTETAVSISEEEFERAKLLFQSAEKLFSESKLNQRNLYDGAQKWQESRELFKKFYEAADHNANLAKSRLDKQIGEWKTEVIINYKKRDFKAAHEFIQNILAAVPAIEDSSYRWAKDREPRILKELKGVNR